MIFLSVFFYFYCITLHTCFGDGFLALFPSLNEVTANIDIFLLAKILQKLYTLDIRKASILSFENKKTVLKGEDGGGVERSQEGEGTGGS